VKGIHGGSRPSPQWVNLRLGAEGPWRHFDLAWDYLANHNRLRPWLVCSRCLSKRRHLYLSDETDAASPWLCRVCLGLQHGIKTVFRAQKVAWRVRKLRESIGAEPHPFGQLPRPPRRRDSLVKHLEALREIGELEDQLLAGIQSTTRSLQRLAEKRGFIPKTSTSSGSKSRVSQK
jgi:hypothetical protein